MPWTAESTSKTLRLLMEPCTRTKNLDSVYDYKLLPDFTELQKDKKEYAKSFFVQYSNTDPFSGKRLVEPYEGHVYVVQNPPAKPLSQEEMDDVYDLPYMRTYHPSYEAAGGVPAYQRDQVQPDQ